MSKTPIVILAIISILFSKNIFQEPEEDPRIVETEKDLLVFHWQLVEWEGNEVLCKLEIQHEVLPEQSDVFQQCEDGVLEIWQNTPHCKNQLSLEGTEPCTGVYVQFVDKEFKTITEMVTFKQADVRIEQVVCTPGSTCSQNPGVKITAEEPMPQQSIASIHIHDGVKETVCQGDSCFMKITPKDGATHVKKTDTIIVFLHSWSNSKIEIDYSYIRLAKRFAEAFSLLFDYRGHGDSIRYLSSIDVQTIARDIELVVNTIMQRYSCDRVLFVCKGISAFFLMNADIGEDIFGAIFISPIFDIPYRLRSLENNQGCFVDDVLISVNESDRQQLREELIRTRALPNFIGSEKINGDLWSHQAQSHLKKS